MLIPAWHLAFLWLIYAVAYMRRFWLDDRRHKYICLGKGISRLVLAGVYFYLAIYSPEAADAQILVRWSLIMFLWVDLIYIVQENIMQNRFRQ